CKLVALELLANVFETHLELNAHWPALPYIQSYDFEKVPTRRQGGDKTTTMTRAWIASEALALCAKTRHAFSRASRPFRTPNNSGVENAAKSELDGAARSSALYTGYNVIEATTSMLHSRFENMVIKVNIDSNY
ncbi:hypothetical protein HII31_13264, partial [Pseudocercospora fuligena]